MADDTATFVRKSAPPADADDKRGRKKIRDSNLSFDGLARVLAGTVLEAVRPLVQRIDALERRLDDRKYLGVFENGRKYRQDNSVTFKGAIWVALKDTQQIPGDGDGWQLAVRRGRDGRGTP
jgi:hypothetical protein